MGEGGQNPEKLPTSIMDDPCRSVAGPDWQRVLKASHNYKRVAPLTFFGPLKQKSGPFNVLDRGHLNSPDC